MRCVWPLVVLVLVGGCNALVGNERRGIAELDGGVMGVAHVAGSGGRRGAGRGADAGSQGGDGEEMSAATGGGSPDAAAAGVGGSPDEAAAGVGAMADAGPSMAAAGAPSPAGAAGMMGRGVTASGTQGRGDGEKPDGGCAAGGCGGGGAVGPTWGTPMTVMSGLFDYDVFAETPLLVSALDDGGVVVVTVGEPEPVMGDAGSDVYGRGKLYASTYRDGSWSATSSIETSTRNMDSSPVVALDRQGVAVAAWSNGSGGTIEVSRYQSSSGWTAAAALVPSPHLHVTSPGIGISAAGAAIATWMQWDGSRYDIFLSRSMQGAGWSVPEKVDTSDVTAADPLVELNDAGDAIVLWRARDTAATDILVRRYAAAGGAGQPLRVDGYKGSQVPSLTLELRDQAAVLAVGAGDDPNYLRAHVSANGTDWDPGARLGSNLTHEAYREQVAVAPDGRAIAAWMESADMVYVFAAEYTPGGGWGAAQTLSIGEGFLPQISNFVNGQAIAVWSDLTDQMWFDRYVSGTGWVGAAPMLGDQKAHGPMQIALDRSGHAWLAYIVVDGSSFAVRASRLE